jgi:hypothetical protein
MLKRGVPYLQSQEHHIEYRNHNCPAVGEGSAVLSGVQAP